MTIQHLENLIKGYYEITGHHVEIKGPVLIASLNRNGILEQILVVLHEHGSHLNLEALDQLNAEYPDVRRKHFISTGPQMKSPEIKQRGYHQQTPLNFFDLADTARGTASVVDRIVREGIPVRIPETYTCDDETGEDLVERVMNDVSTDTDGRLRVIIAPAGYGKSVFMKALFLRMNADFMDAKNRLPFKERPHIILPDHLISEQKRETHNVSSAITRYLSTEYSTVNNPTFEYYIKKRLGILLFDGVEELIQQNPSGTIYELLDNYISCGERSQVVITVRQQMLSAYSSFAHILEEYSDWIKIYQIQGWSKAKVKKYIHHELDPVSGPRAIEHFADSISDQGMKLLSTPYYAKKVCDECRETNGDLNWVSELLNDEQALVGTIIKNMLTREYKAGLNQAVDVEKQRKFLVDLAEAKWCDDKISLEHLDYAAGFVGMDVKNDKYFRGRVEDVIAPLKRHPLLLSIGEDYDFTHEIIGEYFIYLYLDDRLRNNKFAILRQRSLIQNSLLFRGLAQNAHEYHFNSGFMKGTYLDGLQANNIFRLLLESSLDPAQKGEFLSQRAERTSLEELNIKGLDLKSAMFCESNLKSAVFEDCDLTGANFNQAVLKGTTFNSCKLKDATFEQVDFANGSAYVDGQLHEGSTLRQVLHEKSEASDKPTKPCEAALDLETMLESILKRSRGCKDPVNIKCIKPHNPRQRGEMLDACEEVGILTVDRTQWYWLNRDSLQEVVMYCQHKLAGSKISAVLKVICKTDKCTHLPGG